MKKTILLSFLTVGLLITSCKKELNIDSPNEFTLEVFWKTESDAVKGVNSIYSTLHRGPSSRWSFFQTIIRSDEGKSQSPWPDLPNFFDKFLISDKNHFINNEVYGDNYIGIFRANQVLDNVPAINMDAGKKQRLIGEAKFLRGLFYYNLASLWGNVPVLLSTSKPTDLPGNSTQAQVWAQVQKDLAEAAEALPASYSNSADLGRATKGAAYALLAKAYMQEKKFDLAQKALQWMVEGEGKVNYDLMPNYRDNFLITSENNKESVFEWQFALNAAENHDDDTDPRTGNLNYGTSISQFFSPVGWADGEACKWVVDEMLLEKTAANARDPRIEASFLYENTDERGPDYTMVYGEKFSTRISADRKDRVWFRKFLNDHWKNQEGYNSPNNYRFIRYADVLLMYAECLNEINRTADAYQYVDRVRQRAGLQKLSITKPGLTKAQFLAQIKHERVTELSGEGHRWNDLARWGELGPIAAQRDPAFNTFTVGKHELLPIPQRDIDNNPKLKQNPNW